MTTSKPLQAVYCWFDLEFTDLDPAKAAILQLALWLTDVDLRPLEPGDTGLNLVVQLPPDTPVSPWVAEHLADLLERCRSPAATPVGAVEQLCTQYLDRLLGPPVTDITLRPVLAGNSVHNDWRLAALHFPALLERLHYRLLDISTLKQQWLTWLGQPEFEKEDAALVKRWLPFDHIDPAGQRHDAFYDILASIAELHFYRTQWLQLKTT